MQSFHYYLCRREAAERMNTMASYKDLINEKLSGFLDTVKEAAGSIPEAEMVKDVYSRGLSRTKAYGRMAKLALEINSDSNELNRIYAEIGKLYFEENRGRAEGFYAPLFSQAEDIAAGIKAKQAEIDAARDNTEAERDIDVEITEFEDIVNATETDGSGETNE